MNSYKTMHDLVHAPFGSAELSTAWTEAVERMTEDELNLLQAVLCARAFGPIPYRSVDDGERVVCDSLGLTLDLACDGGPVLRAERTGGNA